MQYRVNSATGCGLQNKRVKFPNRNLSQNMINFIDRRLGRNEHSKPIESFQIKKIIGNNFLSNLIDADFVKFLSYLEPVILSAGEDVYRADEPVEYIYFPENAVFSQLDISAEGRICEVSMTGREGIVGFSALLESCPTKFWTQVSVAGTAFKIRTDIFRREFVPDRIIQKSLFE